MINVLKVIIMLVVLLLIAYPLLPIDSKAKKFPTFYSVKYKNPDNKKNLPFAVIVVVEFVVLAVLFGLLNDLIQWIYAIPFIGKLLSSAVDKVESNVDFIFFVIQMVIVNILILYVFVFLKGLLKRCILNPIFGIETEASKKRKERKKKRKALKKKSKKNGLDTNVQDEAKGSEGEDVTVPEIKRKKKFRVPFFSHSEKSEEDLQTEETEQQEEKKKKSESGRFVRFIKGLFFEGDEFEYARKWVVRTRLVLQTFVYFVEIVYALLFVVALLAVLFPMPDFMYTLLIDLMHVDVWYIYPFVSVIFLQEICNVFDAPPMTVAQEDDEVKLEEKKQAALEARLRALQAELKRRFDEEHSLRYYPEMPSEKAPEYVCTTITYASAMAYIRKWMEATSGRVVESYMECLDAIFNDGHVYFAASFYSELGEYLVAYAYMRLLAGARMVFVVSNDDQRETLKKYIVERLTRMTGCSMNATWRVYTSDERLDQADIWIASTSDFASDNVVEQYPTFFEEVTNAVFIDADKMIAYDGYLCTVMAKRLQKFTNGRIRFVFLSLNLLKGFAAAALPKSFCVENVLSFSSAKEHEAVAYTLWNKESKKNKIYNRSGQKNTSLEYIIAEQACEHGVDGVRLITEAPIEHGDRKILSMHDVEINNLFKDVSDVNYMVYSDEKCNLSAALYACTRFRGKKKSIVHIISKPYLLREYFMTKAIAEDHINRSSFIQPRVTEHVERYKLSLLKIFCDATTDKGMRISEFQNKMRDVIRVARERQDEIHAEYCREMALPDKDGNVKPIEEFTIRELAAYLLAGLYDKKGESSVYSIAHSIKDYYIIVDPNRQDGYSLINEKYIVFIKVKDIFDRLLEVNRKVQLSLNDKVIGLVDTFPERVHLEYVAGQSIMYNNSEYEIEQISNNAIYLRRENTNLKSCLDTVHLRRYEIESLTQRGPMGVLHDTKSILKEIQVTMNDAVFKGETYGFYSLMTDRQTIDFYRGAEGNPHLTEKNVRDIKKGKVLSVALHSTEECNDGMRMLLAAVLNEFIRTLFPSAYRCIAICPVLAEPLPFNDEVEALSEIERIKALYPYIKNADANFIETDPNRIQFMFINDCEEDVGVLDWFYDKSARYMQEFLANVYSYLHWLQLHSDRQHYIYFGGEGLPECYDLENCCKLLSDYNLILSDEGKKDIETAGEDENFDKTERCAFCHRVMESGRYSYFDDHRFICVDCFDVIDNMSMLEDLYLKVREYLTNTYPEVVFGGTRLAIDELYDLKEGEYLSEYYYRINHDTRTISVERDSPQDTAAVSLLRGLVEFWQKDNDLLTSYSLGQLYYEELCYLRSLGKGETAEWIYNALEADIRAYVDEIDAYIKAGETEKEQKDEAVEEDGENSETTEETDESKDTKDDLDELDEELLKDQEEKRTSFTFMHMKAKEIDHQDEVPDDEHFEDEGGDNLYDPNKVPRFFKRFLRGQDIDDQKEEDVSDAENEDFVDDGEESDDVDTTTDETLDETTETEDEVKDAGDETPNSPPPGVDDMDDATEESADEETDETDATVEDIVDDETDEVVDDTIDETTDETTDEVEGDITDDTTDDTVEDDKKAKKKGGFFSFFKKSKKDDKKSTVEDETKKDGEDDKKDDGKKDEKKKGGFFGFLKKSKKDDKKSDNEDDKKSDGEDDKNTDLDGVGEDDKNQDKTSDEDGKKKEKPKKEKKDKKDKDKKKGDKKAKAKTIGERILPVEEDEATNPLIRLYNEMVRACYNYEEATLSREGISDDDMNRVFTYVRCDYPEIFWLQSYAYTSTHMYLKFRCRTPNGKFDVKQVDRKRKELRKAAKQFTAGIGKKTDPYKAVLTIYRRLILSLDYDYIGLDAHVDEDISKDDSLRSLYSALVEHKVVCAGYAVAMQYLLQSVGIVSAYVISEIGKDGVCHAFNMVKLGKYVYYVDPTWGDLSNNKTGQGYKDYLNYQYFCVPYSEFVMTGKGSMHNHVPRRKLYPQLKQMQYTNHEYHRYHKAMLTRYNEDEIARIIKEAALRYNKKEMGAFMVSIRCIDIRLKEYTCDRLWTKRAIFDIIKRVIPQVKKKNKEAAKLLEKGSLRWFNSNTSAFEFYFIDE